MLIQNLAGSPAAPKPALRHSRSLIAKAGLLTGGLMLCLAAQAQVVIFDETFSTGLGKFTAAGTVNTSGGNARMQGCYGCTDGSITSNAISTAGFSSIRLSYDRTSAGLDAGEGGVAEYSVNGGAYTALESGVNATGRVTFNLPSTVAGQSAVRLRFRVNASLSSETFTVDNVRLEGTSGTGGTSNPYQKGPDPTTAILEATTGPFTYTSTTVTQAQSTGYLQGTTHYPTNATGPFAAVAIVPGYLAYQASIDWWGPRLASHGFVVFTLDTNSIYDLPPSRATQLMAALAQLKTFNTTSTHPVFGKVDPNRLGVMGWSYGGGGTLIAAKDNPTLKAAIPFAPKTTASPDYSGISVPTMIIGCEADTTAAPDTYAIPYYNTIPSSVKKAYLEINAGTHFCPTSTTATAATKAIMGKYGVSWLKRFMDNDTRYSTYLCGAPHQADLSNTAVISDYREDCPY